MAMAAIGAPLRRVSQIAPTMRLLAEMMIMSTHALPSQKGAHLIAATASMFATAFLRVWAV